MPVLVIPAAALVVIALLALLLLIAWAGFAKGVSSLVPDWHIPTLGSLRGWIESHLADVGRGVATYFDAQVAPFVNLVAVPIIFGKAWIEKGIAAAYSMYQLLHRIVTIDLPRLRSDLAGYVNKLIAAAQAYAHSLVHALAVKIENELHDVRVWVNGLIAAAEAYAIAAAERVETALSQALHDTRVWINQLIASAEAYALRQAEKVEAWAVSQLVSLRADMVTLYNQLAAKVVRDVAAAEAKAEAFAKAQTIALETELTKALVTDIETPIAQVIDLTDDITKVAAGAFTDVIDDLDQLVKDIPRDIPAAIATTLAISVPLLKLARDCTIPNCRNLSQVGRDLQALFGAVEAGGIIALIGEAAADPTGVANTVHNVLGPIVSAGADEARHMAGAA